MKTNINHAFDTRQVKDKEFHKVWEKRYFAYLLLNIATNSMVCNAIGTECKNGCRYKRILEKKGLLKVVFKGICKLTKRTKVQFLSTNPEIILRSK
jgi:hypothetical protein